MSNDSILEVMLNKLSKPEIISLLISNIKVICGEDEKHLNDITHEIVCYVQCTEILADRDTLEQYQESHRKELFTRLLPIVLGQKTDEKVVDVFYNEYQKSKLPFNEWKIALKH